LLHAPTSSTRDHQPRDVTRGRLRTPSTTTGKLRLTRRAWLLLWLTAALIVLADGGLLLRGASVTVMLEGRSRSLPAGLTVAQALERIGRPAAGDLLAVDHSVLHKGAYPPRCWSTANQCQEPDASSAASMSPLSPAGAGSSP
jgi:sulfur carrier protein ThiS